MNESYLIIIVTLGVMKVKKDTAGSLASEREKRGQRAGVHFEKAFSPRIQILSILTNISFLLTNSHHLSL